MRGYSREKYQTLIWTYEKRREQLRKKYNALGKQIRRSSYKIGCWKHQMKEIDKKSEQLRKIRNIVNYYFNVRIEGAGNTKKHLLARNCFAKYSIEKLRIRGSFISEYIGKPENHTARRRLYFTRSFKTNPKLKELYHSFKNYADDQD